MKLYLVSPVFLIRRKFQAMGNARENLTVAFGTHAGSSGRPKSLVTLRAVVTGLLIAMVAANVWPLLLLSLGVPAAAIIEVIFLALYFWWAGGAGPPRGWQAARAAAFRGKILSPAQWTWGLVAAFFFAVTIHASLVLLFRFVPFPTAAFRQGYDFSFIPTLHLRWLAVVISAVSAAICEETGFRGYMQQPIELSHGAPVAVAISSFLFMAVHLTKSWALVGMIPIVFGAGLLLGLLAWSSESLIPGMIGHTAMDVGLFAYWWTGIAGTFTARPISESGADRLFVVAGAALTISLSIVLLAIAQLRRKTGSNAKDR
jgi:membrane protease YdiL (CAAX protease family)